MLLAPRLRQGTIEVVFEATEAFANPFGNVLGAFLAAMLYDTVGPALLAKLAPDQFKYTLDLSVRLHRPAPPRPNLARGRGVHRVQRVPATESSGRIHTSTVTVAVLPEADDVDIKVEDKDVQVDVYRSSGPGGQGVNTTDSAVRLTHLPTGLVVTCQDERSQIKNRAKAMRVLKARLLERAQTEQAAAIAADRRSQVGTGERSERIRTYNFPQGRVSDHRINLTLHRLPAVVEGDLDELIDGLRDWDQSQKLAESVQ